MIVICLSDCPSKLRGDLSKWLFEINTGVFVGNLSARVRDELWKRVCENCASGRAAMVFSASGEQKLDFRVHNTSWECVDFDGIKLMRRPLPNSSQSMEEINEGLGFSKAAKMQIARRMQSARAKRHNQNNYTVIDIETTGLSTERDRIIELAALKIVDGEEKEEYSVLVNPGIQIPEKITELTGISDGMIKEAGINPIKALEDFFVFLGRDRIVSHNAVFDYEILRAECKRYELRMIANLSTDTLMLAREKITGVADYKLTTLAEYIGSDVKSAHRALEDCRLTNQLYKKLNEI